MESIKMIIAYASSKNIKVYQKDVKSAFLNGELEEEVYIEQPEGFAEKGDYVKTGQISSQAGIQKGKCR